MANPAPHTRFLTVPMIQAQPLDGSGQTFRTPGLAQAARPPAQRLGALSPAVEGRAGEAQRPGRLLAGQPLRHGLAPARQRIASSGGFDSRGLRRQKTRRAPGIADNMAGQAKNLHGVLLVIRASTPRTSENPAIQAINLTCV